MSDTNRVQEWRKRQKDQGKEPVTVWLSREEKRRLEGLAKTWHCSTSELVQQALAAYHPENPPVTAAVTDTEQLRHFITATVTDIVTATLPAMVREMVEGMALERVPLPVTATGNNDVAVTRVPGKIM
jgi:predicted transcriptional regulator